MGIKTYLFSAAMLIVLSSVSVLAGDLTVKIENLEQEKGKLYLRLIASQQSFDTETNTSKIPEGDIGISLPVAGNSLSWQFNDLQAGVYALQAFQDLNDNGELDTNLFGIPTEPWGMSNNPAGSFGRPEWQDTRFTQSESDSQISIDMHR